MSGDGAYDRPRWTVAGVLAAAFRRLRRTPSLLVPFTIAGVVLAAVDALRRRDPIPVLEHAGLDEATVHLEIAGYPTPTGRTTLPLESLVGLELPSLAWGLGLYVCSLLAVAVAGVLTLTRLLDGEARLGALPSYLGLVAAFDLAHRAVGSIDLLQGMGLLGLVPLAVLLWVLVRLFAAPGLAAAGATPWTALRESGRRVGGDGWSALGLLAVLGIVAWLLASVPVVGPVLTGAVVAPVHAVAIASLFEHRRASDRFEPPR